MKKKAAAGVAAAVAVVSIATNLVVEPTELIHSKEWLDAHTEEIAVQKADKEIVLFEEDTKEQLSVADAIRAHIIEMPVVIKTLFLLPLWLLGAIPVAIGTSLATVLSPVWAHVVGFLLQAAILTGVFCLVWKLIFPNRSLRELFKPKNFKWVIFGALGITGANLALGQLWAGWSIARTLIMAGVGLGTVALLWKRLCGKFKAPVPGIIHHRYVVEGA